MVGPTRHLSASRSAAPVPDWNAYGESRLLERNRLLFEHHQATLQTFLEFFSTLDPQSRVLDCGCGAGMFLEMLRNLGFERIEGIDLSEPFVERAKQKNLAVRLADIHQLPAGVRFDVITCMELFEHLKEPPYQQLHSALEDDGYLYITVPVYESFQHRWDRRRYGVAKLRQAKDHDPTHIRAYSKQILLEELDRAGFRTVLVRHCFNRMPFVSLRTVWRAFGRLFDAGMFLVVVARKK